MPNGAIHDHPYTDVVYHRVPVFSLELDTLIAEIGTLAKLLQKTPAISDDLSWQMLKVDRFPRDRQPNPEAEVLRGPLTAARDALLAEAQRQRAVTTDVLESARTMTAAVWTDETPAA